MAGDTLGRVKRGYVSTLKGGRAVAHRSGLLARLDRQRQNSRTAHWLRSLFAIHDIDEMVQLDTPWWTYDAIDEVAAFLAAKPDARVFEYGSGASTVWLGRRAGAVTSVEHDRDWLDLVRPRLAGLAQCEVDWVGPDATPDPDPLYASRKHGYAGTTFAAYARAIEGKPGPYDLIVIDGRARPACLHHALPHLAPDGMIVFDNSNRRPYREAIAASGAKATRYRGRAPSLPYLDETTLLRAAPGMQAGQPAVP